MYVYINSELVFAMQWLVVTSEFLCCSLFYSNKLKGHIDLPGKIEILESELWDSLEDNENQIEISIIQTIWKDGRPMLSSLKYPLFLALSISPLILLLPNQLDAKKLGIEKIYKVHNHIIIFFVCSSTMIFFVVLVRSWNEQT